MPGPRIYTLAEANALVPRLEKLFARIDQLRAELRQEHIRINALELIWGAKVREEENPDHGEYSAHVAEMKRIEDEVEKLTESVVKLSGQVKSVEPALVDFFGVRDGHLVHWCWTRGEKSFGHWHHIDAGFAGRQPV